MCNSKKKTKDKTGRLNSLISKDLTPVCDSKTFCMAEELIGDSIAVADPVKACK